MEVLIFMLTVLIFWAILILFFFWAAKSSQEKKKRISNLIFYNVLISRFWFQKNLEDIDDPQLKLTETKKLEKKVEKYIIQNYIALLIVIFVGSLASLMWRDLFLSFFIFFVGVPLLMLTPFFFNLYLLLSKKIENNDSKTPKVIQIIWYKW